jgi:hypothetical protein
MKLPTSGAAIISGTFAGDNDVEMLAALVAVKQHGNGKVPGHNQFLP